MPKMDDRHGNISRYLLVLILATMALLLCRVLVLADTNVTINATPSYATVVPNVTASNATAIASTTAILHGNVTNNGGGTITTRGFQWGTAAGNYTGSWNETGSFSIGTFQHQASGFTFCTEIFWRAFAINDIGQGNSTEMSFTTNCRPGPPTDFTITQAGPSSITITWTKGIAANITVIRASADGYPSSVTDGYQVYSGNGTSVTLTGFAFDLSAWYCRAWSHNQYGYSVGYAEGSVGNPIGLPAIMFAIGLCGFALWKRDWIRVLLAICIMVWGVFAIPYEIKIAAPLLAIGTVLFFMGILRIIEQRRQETV